VFVRGVESARECDVCGWRFERCLGHWIGGNEINVLATFSAGVATWLACLPIVGLGTASVAIATAVTAAFAVAFYRPSRGLFFALDYLLDPATDPPPVSPPGASDRDRDGGHGRDGRDPPRGPSPPARPPATAPTSAPAAASSESFIPPPGTPYPPPSTVSP
jgi:hypothetical protein